MKTNNLELEGIGTVEIRDSKRAKNIRAHVNNGQLLVTKPRYAPVKAVENFLLTHKKWAQNKLAESREKSLIHDGDVIAPGIKVVFKSSTTYEAIKFVSNTSSQIVMLPSEIEFSDPTVQGLLVAELKRIWRREAKKYIPKRLDFLAQAHSFDYNQLRLKDIRSRWGSCSSEGNININIQLIKLDEELIDHVLLHELVHTEAMNHGDKFWEIFESVRPDARQERGQLKQMTIF